ncbi:MAG: hypothetical protein IPG74_09590 [Flavobacteriales bacterium]|nr:hypothetical protein [Flavobacteriales bacterium]
MQRYVVFLSLILAVQLHAQDSTSAVSGKGLFADHKGFRVGVSLGPRILPGSGGQVEVRYVDQSPSRDSLRQTLDIPAVKVVLAYQLYAEAEFNRFFFQLGVEGFFGKFSSHAPFVGIGITPFRWKSWDVRTSARLTYGSGKYKLGDVVNNSDWFLIGGQKIYDDYLRMNYRDRYIGVVPALTLDKTFGKHWAVEAGASLFITVRHHARVEFYGHNGDGRNSADEGFSFPPRRTTDNASEVALDDVDMDFIRDGEVIDKLPQYYTGLSLLAGVSYMF